MIGKKKKVKKNLKSTEQVGLGLTSESYRTSMLLSLYLKDIETFFYFFPIYTERYVQQIM